MDLNRAAIFLDKVLYGIALGQGISDYNYQMMTLSKLTFQLNEASFS
jgi:hypothetical protein